MNKEEIYIKSSFDGSMQPSLLFRSENENRPLLVALHTWSHDRNNCVPLMLPWCEKYDLNLLCPNFRGPNLDTNPNCKDACASVAARTDILDAISYVCEGYSIDRDNVLLAGMSGGGHMALMMAATKPEIFKAIAAVVPITDLAKWTEQSQGYAKHVFACCETKEEMLRRSPISYVDTIARANLKIFHGKFDHVVPFTHSIELYNRIIRDYPEARVYLDIFDGRHEIDMITVMHWLIGQYQGKSKQKVTG